MNIEKEIKKILKRNKKVEADKAWEISLFRRTLITIGTYITILIFLFMIEAPNPYLTALIPTIAYILSTLTIGKIKQYWINNIYKN